MITQELLGYIRGEIAKGKTREEIHKALLSGGGWSEDDLNEAFRAAIPMQNAALPKEKTAVSPTAPSITSPISPIPAASTIPATPTIATPKISTPVSSVPPSFSSFPSFSALSNISPKPTPAPTSAPMSAPASPSTSFTPPNYQTFSPASAISPLSSPSLIRPNLENKPKQSSHLFSSVLKFLIIFVIVGGIGFVFWFYRPQAMSWLSKAKSFWDSTVSNVSKLPIPFLNKNNNTPVVSMVVPPPKIAEKAVPQIKNCGTSMAPKLENPSIFENDPVLSCLGVSAISCEEAKSILKDDLFPTVFEIVKTPNSCNFKLSYPADSPLVDITGKKLAGQYILCPVDVVKAIDNTKPAAPQFIAPDKTNLSKYAGQIYLYGTLGLFAENNLNLAKIQSLGCEGDYINSVIASYNLKNKK